MCDTAAVVTPQSVLFAKNSDRDVNEAQGLEWHPRRAYPSGAMLRCSWIEIPQARETHAVLISRPFWMWGAEMGANEHGVVIGNEAVFTRQPYAATGLTGMDLLRLALERADTAERACEVIVALLEAHGQGGGCGYENRRFTYHNSFIAADPRSAFVLETAGKHWTVVPAAGARAISNGLTVAGFADEHADRLRSRVTACCVRRARVEALARQDPTAEGMMRLLRDHGGENAHPRYSLLTGALQAPCVHGGGLLTAVQTTASWVAELRRDGVRHWVTATSAPCSSLFKPVSVEEPANLGPSPAARADDSLWWRHERLQRRIARDPDAWTGYFGERDAIETAWRTSPPDTAAAFAAHQALIDRWLTSGESLSLKDQRSWRLRRFWRVRDRRAGLL